MGNESSGKTGNETPRDTSSASESARSSSYKILGDTADARGAGVLGRNTAATGETIGVEGVVSSDDGYGLFTLDDAYVGGELGASSLAVSDDITVDFTGTSGGDHGLEVIDRSTDNSEQISVKAHPEGTAELAAREKRGVSCTR